MSDRPKAKSRPTTDPRPARAQGDADDAAPTSPRTDDAGLADALRALQLALDKKALEPVLLDWVGQHSPPLNLLIRKAVSRQPRVRAVVDFLAEVAQRTTSARLPAGLPPVPTSLQPEWFKRRVG